uniref:Uncharacterized protein n=1 Tax=Setaria italica TaxID=4555 RepID=K3XTT2_SETIT
MAARAGPGRIPRRRWPPRGATPGGGRVRTHRRRRTPPGTAGRCRWWCWPTWRSW